MNPKNLTAPTHDAATAAMLANLADLITDADTKNLRIDQHTPTVHAALAHHDALAAAQTTNDLALAGATEPPAIQRLETIAVEIAVDLATAAADLARQRRVDAALRNQLGPVEAAIAIAVADAGRVLQGWASVVTQHASDDLRAAAQPLIAAIRRAHVAQAATGGRPMGQALDEIVLPDPANHHGPILAGVRSYGPTPAHDEMQLFIRGVYQPVRGELTRLDDAPDTPNLIALRDAVVLPRAAVARAAAYPSRARRDADAAARAVLVLAAAPPAQPVVAALPSLSKSAARRQATVRLA